MQNQWHRLEQVNHQDGKTDFPSTENNGQRTAILYEHDEQIQKDLQWLSEAVSQFYQVHLGRLITENDKLWGDFCRKEFDADGNEMGLELNTFGYDTTRPDVTVPMNKDTVIPGPGSSLLILHKAFGLGH